MGLPLSAYLDTLTNTGPVFLSGTKNIVNNVSTRSFILGKFLRGKPGTQILQGGDKIQETLFLTANRTGQFFNRNSDISWQNPQKDVLAQLDWKFMADHMAWDEAEYLLQTEGLSGDALKTKYKDMAYSKMQRLWDSIIQTWEDALWYAPNSAATYAAMESGGVQPFSIPVFVHENAGSNGRFDTNWTTIEGVNPATYTNWDNARETYDAADPADGAGEGDGLFNAFDKISISIDYQQPPMKDEYFENVEAMGNQTIIACSKNGKAQIMDLHRKGNDRLITPQDAAYPMPRWNGVPIADVAALDTAALYDSSSGAGTSFAAEGTATSSSADKGGPRYYFLNCKYLHMVFHKAKYFKMEPVKQIENKLGVFVQPVQTWGNLVCTSRRVNGLVSPA